MLQSDYFLLRSRCFILPSAHRILLPTGTLIDFFPIIVIS
jgi:hypothetical protein